MAAPVPGSLDAALDHAARDLEEAVDRLRDLADDGDVPREVYDLVRTLRSGSDLTRALRRLAAGRTAQEIHGAFGAPGDWGYETLVGDALRRLYRGGGGAAT